MKEMRQSRPLREILQEERNQLCESSDFEQSDTAENVKIAAVLNRISGSYKSYFLISFERTFIETHLVTDKKVN